MAKLAVETLAIAASGAVLASGYNSSMWSLGTNIVFASGATALDKYVGPIKIARARPNEETAATTGFYPSIVEFSTSIDWVFLIENSVAAAAARKVDLYEYNKLTGDYAFKGFITPSLNTASAHTIKGFKVTRHLYYTGTVSTAGSSTTVTGAGTAWNTARFAVGARVGFGSTDPTQITNWSIISALGSDTAMTVSLAVNLAASTPFVIEEIRVHVLTTNGTTTNGGLFVVKGVNYSDFTTGGTSIAASASTVDNLKLVYWLADAGAVTNITGCGLDIDTAVSNTEQYAYILDSATVKVFKYNIRANDAIVSGKMTLAGANIVITGNQAVTGTLSTNGNGIIATLSHGPGSGVKSLYFVTTTRLYRAALANITAGNITWQSESRTEVPPGGIATYPATSLLSQVVYLPPIDRLLVLTTMATSVRNYITTYPTNSGDEWEFIWGVDTKQQDQSAASSSITPYFNSAIQICSCNYLNGITHIVRHSTSATLNQMFSIPFCSHESYASTSLRRAITPSISTPNISNYVRAYVNEILSLGTGSHNVATQSYKMYYRTSGITDNSGSWTVLTDDKDLSSVAGTTAIQFMFEFNIIGLTCIPARILSVVVIYNDLTTDSHYQPSVRFSDIINKRFAWRFSTAFSSTVPALRIRLYDAVTGALLLDDTTTSGTPLGTFEKTTDTGSNWTAYNTTDKANETTWIRYTPTSIADNTKVRALLTLN